MLTCTTCEVTFKSKPQPINLTNKVNSLKKWYSLSCPVCGFRFPLKKFNPAIEPIDFPAQIVTGGGRAKGFKVVKYLPWSTLPTLKQTDAWNSLLCLYNRLGAAYDHFYQVLGFLSPKIKTLLQQLQRSYVDSYRTSPLSEYVRVYASMGSLHDIVAPYGEDDYPEAYAHLLTNSVVGGLQGG